MLPAFQVNRWKSKKSGLDLIEDNKALEQIGDVFSIVFGDQSLLDGSNSFQQFSVNSPSSGGGDAGDGGDGSVELTTDDTGGGNGGGDTDDLPIAGDDAFATDEESVLSGVNVIIGDGTNSDIDPDGFELNVTQVNGNDLAFVDGVVSGLLPSGAILVITPEGNITYDANDAYDFLGLNDQDVDTFTYTVSDPGGSTAIATVTITLTGRNDTPEITSIATSVLSDAFTENSDTGNTATTRTALGNVTFSDIDASDTHTAASEVSSVVWTQDGGVDVPIDPIGSLALNLTESAPDSLLTLELDINGNVLSTPDPITGDVGWTFTVQENELDFLGEGETLELVFTITVTDDSGVGAGDTTNEADSTTQDITITITGTNDVPVITPGVVTGTVTDISELATEPPLTNAGDRTTSGSISFTDADVTDRPVATEETTSLTWLAQDGTTEITLSADQMAAIEAAFTITPNNDSGSNTNNGTIDWDYTIAESELDFLGSGEVVTAIFTITITDDEGATDTQQITITIEGADGDAPVITPVVVAGTVSDVSEPATTPPSADAGNQQADGSVTFADVDLTDRPIATEATTSVTWLASDGVSILTLSASQLAAFEAAFTISPDGIVGGNSNAGTVTWDYTIAESDLDFLAANETVTAIFTITVTDDEGNTDTQEVEITITGANDAPTIVSAAADHTGSVTELVDGSTSPAELTSDLTDMGTITFADVDLTDTHTATVSGATVTVGGALLPTGVTSLGAVTLGAVNDATDMVDWTFTVNDGAVDFLAEGESITQTFTVTIDDGNTNNPTVEQVLTITINGTNDAPTIVSAAADHMGSVTELVDGSTSPAELTSDLTDMGTITFADVDLTDTHTATVSGATVTAGGALLPTGVTSLGAVTLGAVNDATDMVDWTFTVNDGAVDFLAEGESITQTFTVTIDDGNTNNPTVEQVLTITINGTNDAPTIASVASDHTGSVKELTDGSTSPVELTSDLTDTGTITFADVDLTDTHTATVSGATVTVGGALLPTGVTSLGAVTLGAVNDATDTVDWTFTVNDGAVDFLAKSESITQTFTVTIDDGNANNPTVEQVITVTINGTNDAPTVGTSTGLASTNEDTVQTISGISVGDVDATDTLTVTLNAAGDITLNSTTNLTVTNNGTTTVTIVGSVADINAALAASGGITYDPVENFNGADTITVTADDGVALPVVNTVAVTVNSVNDAPAGADTTLNTNEDTAHVFTISDFGFSDVNDNPADTLLNVTIDTLPANGQILLNGNPIGAGSSVSATDISAGNLSYQPPVNANGDGLDSITFTIGDDGGTANGGVQDDQTPNTITFDVDARADAPTASITGDSTYSDGTPFSLNAAAALTDTDGSETLAVTLGGLPNGFVVSDGTNSVTSNGTDPVDVTGFALGSLTVTPTAGVSTDLTIEITATSTEAQNGDTATQTQTVDVAFAAAAIGGFAPSGAAILVDDVLSAGASFDPTITALSNGGFAVAFDNTSGSGGIRVQTFDASGNQVGTEFLVSSSGALNINSPSITTLAPGTTTDGGTAVDFVVTSSAGATTGVDQDIVFNLINNDGSHVSTEALASDGFTVPSGVNAGISAQVSSVSVGLEGGGFVIVYQSFEQDGDSFGIYATTFDTTGALINLVQVNTTAIGIQQQPAITALANGNFGVAWSSATGDVYYQELLAGSGAPVGGEILVNGITGTTGADGLSVNQLTDGNLVAVYQNCTEAYATIFESDGTIVGTEINISASTTASGVSEPSATALANGGFFVVWTADDGAGTGVFGQEYDATGATVGGTILINEDTAGNEHLDRSSTGLGAGGEVVTQLDNGNIVVTYTNGTDVFVRILEANDAPVVTAGATLSFVNAAGAQVIDNTITVSDADTTMMVGATVSITNNFDNTGDLLGFVNQNGISGTYDDTTGILTLTGAASVAEYQAALQSVTFNTTSTDPNPADREITFVVNDGTNDSVASTSSVSLPSITSVPGSPASDVVLMGDAGDNIIFGLGSDDQLEGGAGNDVLIGGNGSDVLIGGAGIDQFVMLASTDTTPNFDQIVDFDITEDILNIADLVSASFDPDDPEAEITFFASTTDLFVDVNGETFSFGSGVTIGDTINVIHDNAVEAIQIQINAGLT